MNVLKWLSEVFSESHQPRGRVRRLPSDVGRTGSVLESRVCLSSSNPFQNASSAWFGSLDVSGQMDSDGLSGAVTSQHAAGEIPTRQFLVRLTPEATARLNSPAAAQQALASPTVNFQVVAGLGLPGQILVVTGSLDAARIQHNLNSNSNVAWFEEDFSVGATATFPNEETQSPLFVRQWGLHNTGQTGGLEDADIDAPEAWDLVTGDVGTVVAQIDSGVDYTHPDLYLNIWINQGELPPMITDDFGAIDIDGDGLITFRDLNDPANASYVTDINGNLYIDAGDLLDDPRWADGIDTDGNGFEDDLVGWDFFENDNKPFDEHRHGTHVAGILAATGNNGQGIAGVNWQTTLMPLRFLDGDNKGDLSDAVEAINYSTLMKTRNEAAANIRVSNNSWGSSTSFSQALHDAVAGNRDADILFVAAAGNGDILGQGINNDQVSFYPADLELDNVISVAAMDDRGRLATFSNFGVNSVDIAAPGLDIISTEPGRSYIARSGTSMATPHVAGVAALVFHRFPSATALEVRDAILTGADSRSTLVDRVAGGRSLNALGALTASTFAPVPNLVSMPDITSPGLSNVSATVTYQDQDGGSVQTSGFDIRDVEIRRTGFSETVLTPVLATATTVDGLPAAEYRFEAPGGTWDATENGTWSVYLREGEISDNQDLYTAPRLLGTFQVAIADASVVFVNTTQDTVDADPGDGIAADADGRVSLRAAMMHANAASVATTIVVPEGVYTLTLPGQNEDLSATGDLDLTSTQGITIIGAGALSTIVDAQQLDRVFDVAASSTVSIQGLTIRNGNADSGGGIRNAGTLHVTGTLVTNNRAEVQGGGISSTGPLTIADSSLEHNSVTSRFFGFGGGGLLTVAPTSISNTSFVQNTSATAGGGILVSATSVNLQHVTISGNVAERGDGGGVLLESVLDSELNSTTIVHNAAPIGSGGGLRHVIAGNIVTINNSIVAQNTARTSPDVEGTITSAGNNLFGQPSETNTNWRTLQNGVADFDQIGTSQSPLLPGLEPVRRHHGIVQAAAPTRGGLAANTDVAGVAELALRPGMEIVYSTVELEPNNSRGEAMRLDDRGWSLDEDPNITNSTTIPHVTITGTGDGTFDYFSFTVSEPNATAVFDIDNGSLTAGETFNTKLFLFDTNDNLLASNDDGSTDPGSNSGEDARIEHTFSTPGYYTVAVGAFDSNHSGFGQLTGTAPAADTRYVLNISLSGHALAETTYNPTSSNTLFPVAGTASDETYLFSAREGLSAFSWPTTFSTAQSPDAVTLSDFDGDGITDVATANRHSDNVSVLKGNGDGSFQPAVEFAVGANPQSIHTGDVDNDGIQDIVTGNKDDGTVSVLRGNGDGTFATAEHFPVGSIPQSVVVIDVSGDGILDLVSNSIDVSVLIGNGDATFQTPQEFDVASFIDAVTVGDIDGDGIEDIVTAHGIGDEVNVLKGNGDATFQSAQVFSVGDGPRSVVIDDINGDGLGDIVTGNYFGHDVSVLLSNGDGSFQPSQLYSVGHNVDDVLIADVNGDRIRDIITANSTFSNDGVSILLGKGDGTFQAAESLAVRDSSALGLGDVDGDGTVDIVASNSAFDEISVMPARGARLIEVSENQLVSLPARETPIAFATQQDTQYWLASTTDDLRFVLWSFSLENGVRVTRDIAWTGETVSTPVIEILDDALVVRDDSTSHEILPVTAQETVTQIADGTFETAVTLGIGSVPHSVILHDVNGDGVLDVVSDGIDLVVLQGNEDGTFQPPDVFDVASGIDAVAVGDIDGDGIDDAVTAHATRDEVNILKGNGDGSFQEAVVLPVGDAPRSLAVRDVNNDGFSDIITGNVFGDDVSVLLSNGDGSFQAAQSLDIGRSVNAVAVDDVDGDGHLDVVTANGTFSNDGVSILLGKGDGTFEAAESLAVRDSSALALGDVDGDGTVDIVASNSAFDEISVLRGNGGGTFQSSRSYPVGDSPSAVILGDVNGDAIVDILAVNESSDDVTVVAGNGDGTFRFANTFPVGDDPVAAALGDINRDGLLDIVTANRGSDDISILTGRSSVTNVLKLDHATVFGGRNTIHVRPGTGSERTRLPLTPVASATGILTQSRDYEFVDLAVFGGQLLALVRLTGAADRRGELQLLLIDAPEFDEDTGVLLPSDVDNLTLNSNLRLITSNAAELFSSGDSIYLTAEIVGSGLGEELLAFGRANGLRLVGDLLTGPQSSEVRDFVAVGDQIAFTAFTSRIDNTTQQPTLRRELFVLNPEDFTVQAVRAGQEVTGPPAAVESTLFFHGPVTSGGPDQLWSFDVTQSGVPSIGAFQSAAGNVSGTVFLDINGDGRRDAQEPGRAGVTVFADLNHNGRREAHEPVAVSRTDDPATAADETGSFLFSDLPAGTYALREVLEFGFSQTAPLTVSAAAATLQEISAGTNLGTPSVVGDNVVYVDVASGNLIFRNGQNSAVPLVNLQSVLPDDSQIVSLGTSHAQDGTTILLTAVLDDGRELLLNVDTSGRLTVMADTGSPLPTASPGQPIGSTTLADIEDVTNRGFVSLSLSGGDVGFLAETSTGVDRYFLGDGQRFAEFQHAQVLLDGGNEVFVDRIVEETGAVISGDNLFLDKATLDPAVGGSTGWQIVTRSGDVILPLTFFDRLLDVAVSGNSAVFRAITVTGDVNLYRATAGGNVSLVAGVGDSIPDSTLTISGLGSVPDGDNHPAVAIDGDRLVFVATVDNQGTQQVGLFASIDGQLRTLVDASNSFNGRTLSDIRIGHQALSGNRIAFLASFTDGSQAVYLAQIPAEPVATVTVTAGGTVTNVLFGASAAPGTIQGVSFTDINGNGVFDNGEPVNSGRTLFLDDNRNGLLDSTERRFITNDAGEFRIPELAAETSYVLRQVLPDGLSATTLQTLAQATILVSAASTVEVNAGSIDSDAEGESSDGVVTGFVYDDANGNGVRDAGEAGLPGVRVYVDRNGDGQLNGGERSAVTAADGSYRIDSLLGDRHRVRLERPDDRIQIAPLGNSFSTQSLNTIDSPVEVVAADFNGDGHADLATTIDQASEVQFFLNDGSGNLTASGRVEVAGGPGSLAVGQFAAAGGASGLVVGHRTTNFVKVLLPQASGTWSVVDLITPQLAAANGLGNAPYFVTTGNFTGGIEDDIAVVSQNALPHGGVVTIFRNNGNSTFTREQSLNLPAAAADFPTAITAGLVNSGSTVDLVIANAATSNVTILSNLGTQGSNRFVIDQHRPLGGTQPTSVQLGDLNNDGHQDIVTTNLLSNNVSVLMNGGNGTFSPASLLPAGTGPAYVRLVDLDLDGSLDIAFTNSDAENRFGILRNLGDGTFQAAETSGLANFQDGTLAFSLDIADFNRDGTPDVVVSNRFDQALNGIVGGLTVGTNSVVAGGRSVLLTAGQRTASGLNFGLQTLNRPPTLNDIADPAAIAEDAAQQTVSVTGISTGGETEPLQVSVTSSNLALINPTIVFNPGSGIATVSYTPTPQLSGVADVTVTVRDPGADGIAGNADDGLASSTFRVIVNAVNDLPEMTQPGPLVLNEGAAPQTVSLSGIHSGLGENQPLRLTVSSSNPALIPTPQLSYTPPASTGSLVLTPMAHVSGTSTITLTLEDGGLDNDLSTLSDNATRQFSFTVTVNAVNDPPTLSDIPDFTFGQTVLSQVVLLSGISSGPGENQPVKITASSSNPSVIFLPQAEITASGIVNGAAPLGVSRTPGLQGTATISVRIEDGGLDNNLSTTGDNAFVVRMFDVSTPAAGQVNAEPTINTPANVVINENAGQQTVTLTGISPGAGETQPVRLTVSSSNPGLIPTPQLSYSAPSTTGSLTFTPVGHASGTATIGVTIEDGGLDQNLNTTIDNATRQVSFTVTVNAVNDLPTLSDIPDFTFEQTVLSQVVLLSGISSGPGENQPVKITASSSNPSVIFLPQPEITASGIVNGAAPLEVSRTPGLQGTATISVRIEDGGLDNNLSTTGDNAFVVRMFDVSTPAAGQVNAEPTINTPANVVINENAGQQTVTLTGISPGAGETQPVRLTVSSSNPNLIPTPQLTYTAASTTGSLTFTPVSHASGTATISVTIEDGGLDQNLNTTIDNATRQVSFTVTVNAVNDPPTLNGIPGATFTNSELSRLVLLAGISSGVGESQPVRVTATLDASDVFSLPNPSIAQTDISAGAATLEIRRQAGLHGTATVTVRVEDGGLDNDLATTGDNLFVERAFVVTTSGAGVTNSAPTIDAIDNIVLDEDAESQTVALSGISAGVDETQPLRLTVSSDNVDIIPTPQLNWTSPASTGSLLLTPVAGRSGTATITVRLEDGGLDNDLNTAIDNATTEVSFAVTVNAVNDPPTINSVADFTFAEDVLSRFVLLSGISSGLGENQPIRVTASSSDVGLIVIPDAVILNSSISGGAAQLEVRRVPGIQGSATVTIRVEDGGLDHDLSTTGDNLFVEQAFVVTTPAVAEVNAEPTIDAVSDLVLDEDAEPQTVVLSGISAGVNETQPLRLTVSSDNVDVIPTPQLNWTSPASTGSLLLAPAAGRSGTATITVRLEDGGLDNDLNTAIDNATTEVSFTVTVTNSGTSTGGAVIDVDGSGGAAAAQSDGLAAFAVLAGVTDGAQLSNLIAPGSPNTPAQVVSRVQELRDSLVLDVDGNGSVNAQSDGLLIFAILAGVTNPAQLSGLIAPGAPNSVAQIIANVEALKNPPVASASAAPAQAAVMADSGVGLGMSTAETSPSGMLEFATGIDAESYAFPDVAEPLPVSPSATSDHSVPFKRAPFVAMPLTGPVQESPSDDSLSVLDAFFAVPDEHQLLLFE